MENATATLLIKNIPRSVENLTNLLPSPALEIKPFGRRRALLTYESVEAACTALEQLQQVIVSGKQLNVAFFCKNAKPPAKPRLSHKTTQANLPSVGDDGTSSHVSKYVAKLYACDANLSFNQPPPPYLKYAYPRINADILDSICIALMSNTRFYTQVLHLMNRMNLEPPFGAKPPGVRFMPPRPKDATTQTEHENTIEIPANIPIPIAVPQNSESELESTDEDNALPKVEKQRLPTKRKAAQIQEAQYKKKARQLLQHTLQQQQKLSTPTTSAEALENKPSQLPLTEMFEQPASSVKALKIAVKLKPDKLQRHKETFVPPTELSTQRLTQEEMQALPIYKNYETGTPSNKLYIKNLSKDVSEVDLIELYARFLPHSQLDVKVMQQGRMKGQAFITFHGLSEVDTNRIIAEALRETNGFMLREKPMVVCYGKK